MKDPSDRGLGEGSHVAPLVAACLATQGDILECGGGWWSTPLLHVIAASQGRKLTTIESDMTWADPLSACYATADHHVACDEDLERAVTGLGHFGLAFVDSSPGDRRVSVIFQLRLKADVIVVHDVEADIPPSAGAYGWKRLNGVFKYEYIFQDVRPWTAIWSDTLDVRKLFPRAATVLPGAGQ